LDYFFRSCFRRAAQRAFIISDNRFLPAGVIPPFLGRPGPLAASPETSLRPRRTPFESGFTSQRLAHLRKTCYVHVELGNNLFDRHFVSPLLWLLKLSKEL
jgi:hypothetical protein